ncbi:uncharacterized protein LOC142235727 [Haematobia irritans]|uniref:uncharacterized protein LOC142235727 n=1 Tax=Haematobia irritans TaxID=7368 RepID=UPI003F50C485
MNRQRNGPKRTQMTFGHQKKPNGNNCVCLLEIAMDLNLQPCSIKNGRKDDTLYKQVKIHQLLESSLFNKHKHLTINLRQNYEESGKSTSIEMPLERSPQRNVSQDQSSGSKGHPESHRQGSGDGNNQQPVLTIDSVEEISARFARQMEEMQSNFLRQINAMQSMVESSNVQIRDTISSLRSEFQNNASNNEMRVSFSNANNAISTNMGNLTHLADSNYNISNPTISQIQFNTTFDSTYTTSTTSFQSNIPNFSQYTMPTLTSVRAGPCLYPYQIANDSSYLNHSRAMPYPTTSGGNISFTPLPQDNNANLHRHKKIYDLPKFSGSPEDWQTFIESFNSTTVEFQYSDLHNIMRLRESLYGKARETVESLLTNSKNVGAILDVLAETFGRPDQLIKSQIQKVRVLPNIKETDFDGLLNFSIKVTNMTTFLQSVGGDFHLANPMLLSELISKLPVSKRIHWAETCLSLGSAPTILDFSKWLHDQGKIIHMVADSLPITSTENDKRSKKFACTSASVESKGCILCSKHCKSLGECGDFIKLPLEIRWQKAKLFKVCFICLKGNHQSSKCFKKKKCDINSCMRFHHRLLHKDQNNITQINNLTNNDGVEQPNSSQQTLGRNCLAEINPRNCSVLFQVIPVRVFGPTTSEIIYAFIDDGANVSMIDEQVARRLEITGQKDTLELQWINNHVSREETQVVTVKISGIEQDSSKYTMRNVYITSKLNLPVQTFNPSEISEEAKQLNLPGVNLHGYTNIKAKMIISLAHAYLTVTIDTPKVLSPSGPIAAKSRLGWIIYGPVDKPKSKYISCHVKRSENEERSQNELDNMMRDYFGQETFGIKTPVKPLVSRDNQRALDILNLSTRKYGDRFETGLLWRNDNVLFPESYEMAFKRLLTVERKMQKDYKYATEYCAKIDEYVQKGYARIMEEEEANMKTSKTFYLPHFGVMNPNKKKMRLVFDAAAETHGVSLNKNLIAGPDLNQPLLKVLFKFREEKIAVCGDLKEMFHQICIKRSDQEAQRFLWREGDPSKPVRGYVMQRLIFGATCSPTIAQYVKNKNAEQFVDSFPRAVKSIKDKHYVDDFVDCFESEMEAVQVVRSVIEIHKAGGFEMHNFVTNSDFVANQLGIEMQNDSVNVGKTAERILGMHWLPKYDKFTFILKFHKVPEDVLNLKRIPTKRELLCIAMSVFDPFGFVANYMIGSKILMQEAWKNGIGWDEKLPETIYSKFKQWLQQIKKLECFEIPRWYFDGRKRKSIQLHIFCDASEQAVAAVAYWRIEYEDNSITINFIIGKTACAPLRFHSIPKLELQGAVYAARLKKTIAECHEIEFDKCFLWTDSRTVLSWIRSDQMKYKQYVENRVSEILEYSYESQWRWCPTSKNPADKATRAHFPFKYDPEDEWKNGPEFLIQSEFDWPNECNILGISDRCKEELKQKHMTCAAIESPSILEKIVNGNSKYIKVRRIVAWILRFINNTRQVIHGDEIFRHELSAEEISEAENLILIQIQKETFWEEYSDISKGKPVSKSSPLLTLLPFLDEKGIIRANGRLQNATCLSEQARNPVILPKGHRYSRLVVEYYHRKNCHQNSAKVICDVREKFWIPSIRSLLRSVEMQCNSCKLRKAKHSQPVMAALPIDRVTPFVRPFSYTGVDIFGPFNIKIRRSTEKRYVALFTCLTVRAVHMEIVADLSTDSFILSLRNFMNRRGIPLQVRSDNGKNFVGLQKELRNEKDFLDHNQINCFLSSLGIKWIFNTPADPSAGGAWERLIQSIKKSLEVLLRGLDPKLEVFQSLLLEAENIVNSRPLTHLPLKPNDPEPLTPNHFLIGTTNSTQTPAAFDASLRRTHKSHNRGQTHPPNHPGETREHITCSKQVTVISNSLLGMTVSVSKMRTETVATAAVVTTSTPAKQSRNVRQGMYIHRKCCRIRENIH